MPDLWMDVDTALARVPINIAPLVDDADFKSIETGLVFNSAGLALKWHFVPTTGGSYTLTAVTPTSGGAYDLTNAGGGSGMYSLKIPATGGASANNDTEGFGWFTGVATGILPWRGPIIGFRAAALNNALIDGGDSLDVNVTELGGDAQSATDLKDFADAGYDPATNKVEGVKLVDLVTTATTLTNLPAITANWLTAAGIADNAFTAAKFAAASLNGKGDWNIGKTGYSISGTTTTLDALQTALNTAHGAGSWATATGFYTGTPPTAGEISTQVASDLQAAHGAGSWQTATGFSTHSAADVVTAIGTGSTLTAAGGTGSQLTALATQASVNTIDGLVDQLIAAIVTAAGEPGQGTPPVSTDRMTKLDYVYKFLRNKADQSATEQKVYGDDGTTVDHKRSVSVAGGTVTIGEVATGP